MNHENTGDATSESLLPNCSNYATLNHICSTVHKCTITFYQDVIPRVVKFYGVESARRKWI